MLAFFAVVFEVLAGLVIKNGELLTAPASFSCGAAIFFLL